MGTNAERFDRAIGRIQVMMLWLTGTGAIAFELFRGWPWALGFLAGAIASLVNFRWLHLLVASLGERGRPVRKRMFVFLSVRYLLLGAAGYVIVICFDFNLAAGLLGLFVAVAAVIIEALYELVYAGT